MRVALGPRSTPRFPPSLKLRRTSRGHSAGKRMNYSRHLRSRARRSASASSGSPSISASTVSITAGGAAAGLAKSLACDASLVAICTTHGPRRGKPSRKRRASACNVFEGAAILAVARNGRSSRHEGRRRVLRSLASRVSRARVSSAPALTRPFSATRMPWLGVIMRPASTPTTKVAAIAATRRRAPRKLRSAVRARRAKSAFRLFRLVGGDIA